MVCLPSPATGCQDGVSQIWHSDATLSKGSVSHLHTNDSLYCLCQCVPVCMCEVASMVTPGSCWNDSKVVSANQVALLFLQMRAFKGSKMLTSFLTTLATEEIGDDD